MTATECQIKQITLRIPETLWLAAKLAALDRRTSVQAIVIESISDKLAISRPSGESAHSADAA